MTAGDDTKTGSFSCVGTAPTTGPYFAYYPYSSENSMTVTNSVKTLSVTMPATQYYAENSFGEAAAPMVAYTTSSDDNSIEFKNLCGMMELRLYADNTDGGAGRVYSITLTSSTHYVAGDATIQMNYADSDPTGTPEMVITRNSNASVAIYLDCGVDGILLSEDPDHPTSFFITIPTPIAANSILGNTSTMNFAVVINDPATGIVRQGATNITINRSKIKRMANIHYTGAVTEYYSDANSYIAEVGSTISNINITPYSMNMLSNHFQYPDTGNEEEATNAPYAKSAAVLWETTSGLITNIELIPSDGDSKFLGLSVTGSSETEGNALVGIFAGEPDSNGHPTGDLLWSYHIWVTDYNPLSQDQTGAIDGENYDKIATRMSVDNGGLLLRNSYTFNLMTRNLGAYHNNTDYTPNSSYDIGSFGLLYQWGRKDPFIGGTENQSMITASQNAAGTRISNLPAGVSTNLTGYEWVSVDNALGTLRYATQHPTRFIEGDPVKLDWLAGIIQNDELWGNNNTFTDRANLNPGHKSIYDPCPQGWRIPPQTAFNRLAGSANQNAVNVCYVITISESEARNMHTSMGPVIPAAGTQVGGISFYSVNDYGAATRKTINFPLAGFRTADNHNLDRSLGYGQLRQSGTGHRASGYYWTSSDFVGDDRFASSLRIVGPMSMQGTQIKPFHRGRRAAGYSIRCMSMNADAYYETPNYDVTTDF